MKRLMLIVAQALLLLAITGAAVWSTLTSARDDTRLAGLHAEMTNLQDVENAIADYAMQVAQYMAQGRAEQEDLQAARLGAERSFLGLGRALRDRVAFDTADGKPDGALSDFENARRMLELYHAVDRAASRAIVLKRDGQAPAAAEMYARDVDYRITTEFAALIGDARARSQSRIAAAEATIADHRQISLIIWIVLVAMGLVSLGLSAWYLWRAPAHIPQDLARDYEARVEELRLTNRRLRELNAHRGQFLADVSHELRTPLTILRGEADVALLPKVTDQERRRSLERIQDQAAELGQLLDDLLAFARSEGEPQPFEPTALLLGDLLATAVEEGETLAEPREVVLDLKEPDKGIWVSAEARRLKQALLIGLDNAINHSPPGGTVAVSMAVGDGRVRIQITDRGSGVSEKDLARVFDRFYRGEGNAGSAGLGIGLAIAKGIVDQHHGLITLANNEAGGGATLTIELPSLAGPLT